MQTIIHNLIILDASGSMNGIKREAIDGFNGTVRTIREAQERHPDQEHRLSLVIFNSSGTRTVHDDVPVAQVRGLTPEDYRPNSGTPLFDALGNGITALRGKVAEGDLVLVTTITDGEENASREYTRAAVRALVEELKTKGWVFTYLGANQDVRASAEEPSIDNSLAWDSTEEGTAEMYFKEGKARSRFFDRIAESMGSMIDARIVPFFEDFDD